MNVKGKHAKRGCLRYDSAPARLPDGQEVGLSSNGSRAARGERNYVAGVGMSGLLQIDHAQRGIEAEAREIIDLARNGGVAVGTHSVSPEIPLGDFAIYITYATSTEISHEHS